MHILAHFKAAISTNNKNTWQTNMWNSFTDSLSCCFCLDAMY